MVALKILDSAGKLAYLVFIKLNKGFQKRRLGRVILKLFTKLLPEPQRGL